MMPVFSDAFIAARGQALVEHAHARHAQAVLTNDDGQLVIGLEQLDGWNAVLVHLDGDAGFAVLAPERESRPVGVGAENAPHLIRVVGTEQRDGAAEEVDVFLAAFKFFHAEVLGEVVQLLPEFGDFGF
jgi:hypothetical protein